MTPEREAMQSRESKRATPVRRDTPSTESTGVDGQMLAFQRTAGNGAVNRVVAARQAASAALGSGTQGPSMSLQLGALWDDLVQLPLARAYEKLSRSKPEEEAALTEIDFALRGIGTIKAATPTSDENHARLDILEIRVTGLRDLVREAVGKGKSSAKLETQMIEWRAEASALGPELTHGPKKPQDEPTDSASADAKSSPAPSSGESAAKTTPEEETMTVAQLWREVVVDNMWRGQRAFDRDVVDDAQFSFLLATNNIAYFALGTPKDDPNRLRLIRLVHGVGTISDMIGQKTGLLDGVIVDSADTAYELASAMGRRLLGQPVEDEAAAEDANEVNSEPAFTWESEGQDKKPFVNDTELMKP